MYPNTEQLSDTAVPNVGLVEVKECGFKQHGAL